MSKLKTPILVSIFVLVGSVLFSILLPGPVQGATGINKVINFQSKVVNANGTNVTDGTYDFVFKFYDGAGSAASNSFTESWTSAALWSSTMSSAPGSGGETLTYSSDTNESTIKVGQILTNTTKAESVVITSVNTGTNILGISPTQQAWANGDTITNKIYVKDGIFRVGINSLNQNISAVDFNTDNVFLGVNFNADGEAKPRIQMAAAAYAFNAEKVNGLTVTNTTGTFTLSNGKTFTVGNSVGFTGTDSTSFVLPTANDTLAGINATQTLSNKTIGSTGLIFSGATSDVSSAAGESLALEAGGTGTTSVVQIGSGGAGSTTPDYLGLDVKSDTGDPAGGAEGYMYYNTADNKFRCYEDVGWTDCIGSGVGGGDLSDAYVADANGGDATVTLSSTDDSVIFTNPSSSGTDSAFTFQINQNNTTAAVSVLDLVQLSNNANGVNLTANSIDDETALNINANGLTGGKGLALNSSTAALTGALEEITLSGSNAANTGNLLKVSNTGTANANTSVLIDHRATGTGNLALRVDDSASDSTPVIIDGDGRVGIGTTSVSGTTERLLQVGSGTNRGNAAIYGEIVTKGFKDIQALTNIRDMMIYDTSLDSDGGRWIDWADTEEQSWFTESLDDGPADPCDISTDDRCYSDAFPRKAIIVVTTDALYIFDATNGNMWMKFSQNASGYALGVDTNNDPSSVTAGNGVIYVGANGSAAGGVYVLDFVNDRMWNIDGTDRSGADVGIGSRNSVVTYNSDNNTALDIATVGTVADWGRINDISVATMKSSSTASTISAVTNLLPGNGLTLLALATDSGITVINLSAQRVLQYSEATDNDYNAVVITSRGRLYALNEALGQAEKWINIDTDKTSEVNGTPDKLWDETTVPSLSKTAPTILAGAPDALEVVERASYAEDASDLIYVGHSLGLTEIHDHSTANAGWSKFIDTARQTALMPATIKGAFMMNDAPGTNVALADSSIRTHVLAAKNTTNTSYGIQGVRGKAVTLNGTSQFFCSDTTGDTACDNDTNYNMGTTGWNLSMWFKHSATQAGNDVLFDRCYNTTPAQAAACVVIWMNNAGNMVAAYDDDVTYTPYTSYDVTSTSSLTYNDNQWHQVILSRNNAGIINFYIDGNPINLSTATASTLTLDAAQIVGIGADCSVGAACATGANFWDGAIDDFTYSAGGGTTTDALLGPQARRLYNDARPVVNKKVITVTDATTATTTTIGDSAETWIPQEFAGQIVTLTGNTGVGQTRRIVSNTATTLTVTPAFSTTPDTTTDFSINPEVLYGASNSVYAIGATKQTLMGESRMVCAGTNSASDTGGVTCFNHQAGPNVVADIYHADSEYFDDSGNEWTGTHYDDIRAIDLTNRTMAIGSEAHTWIETQDVRLGQGMDYLQGKLYDVRGEIITDGISLTGSLGIEVGLTGGADLAEYYNTKSPLDAGTIVVIDETDHETVKASGGLYDRGILGVIATQPGAVLGTKTDTAVPVALAGRVPVTISLENGPIKAGDYLTSSSKPGVAMKATKSGVVIGTAIEDYNDVEGGKVTVFVRTGYFNGTSMESHLTGVDLKNTPINKQGEVALQQFVDNPVNVDPRTNTFASEIVTDRVAAGAEVIAPKVTTQTLAAQIIRPALGKDITVELSDKGEFTIRNVTNPDSPVDVISFDSNGNAYFSGTITAQNIQADQISGLRVLTNELYTDSIKNLVDAKLKDATAAGNLITSGQQDSTAAASLLSLRDLLSVLSLSQNKEITLATDTFFNRLATFFGNVTFKKDVSFEGRPTFNADTGGYAVIRKNARYVTVIFDKEFTSIPVINAVITLENQPKDEDNSASEEAVLGANVQYIISKVSTKGFSITLNKIADTDLRFSWSALSVDKAKTAVGLPIGLTSTPLPSPRFTIAPIITASPTSAPQITISAPVETVTITPSPNL